MMDKRFELTDDTERHVNDIISDVFRRITEELPSAYPNGWPNDDRFEKTVAAAIYDFVYDYGAMHLKSNTRPFDWEKAKREIAEEEYQEESANNGQFGVGA